MAESMVHVIDDDEAMRDSLSYLLESTDIAVRTYESAIEFLSEIDSVPNGCVVTDVRMPEMSGLDLVRRADERADRHVRGGARGAAGGDPAASAASRRPCSA